MRITTRDVSEKRIGSTTKQFVVVRDGQEVGVISKHGTGSAWNAFKGIGFAQEHVGNYYSKQQAVEAAAS